MYLPVKKWKSSIYILFFALVLGYLFFSCISQKHGQAQENVCKDVLARIPSQLQNYSIIQCNINNEYSVSCRRERAEIYVPFSLIRKYFEIEGFLNGTKGTEKFDWIHSYASIYGQDGNYSPTGEFMYFKHYNVELRQRCKCISGIEGVPVSQQWGSSGFFYPIQVAQYGLSHYSKFLLNPKSNKYILFDGEIDEENFPFKSSRKVSFKKVYDNKSRSHAINISSATSNLGVTVKVNEKKNFFLSLDFFFTTNGSITLIVLAKRRKKKINLHYICSNTLIHVEQNNIYYGIGKQLLQWRQLHRDIKIDIIKAMNLIKREKVTIILIESLQFHGSGLLDNITFSENAHLIQSFYSADWLIKHQDVNGGWQVMAKRYVGQSELKPGWYSAMAQGQAISLLVRIYTISRQQKYLDAALNAVQLYNKSSRNGGIHAKFADKYIWYEEYPTIPSSYVLNGFIYALFGLYDLQSIIPSERSQEIRHLYEMGILSLKAMLPLYDTGSGTVYDLRHFTQGTGPNRARWDYHTTHIDQLLALCTIESDPIFKTTAKRWLSYLKGHKTSHN